MQQYTGEVEPLGTCHAHNGKTVSRRDYWLVPTFMLRYVRKVYTLPLAGYDVHEPIRLKLGFEKMAPAMTLRAVSPCGKPDGMKLDEWRAK
eukprot:1656153-Alexandrium_andersonii.AAC.1